MSNVADKLNDRELFMKGIDYSYYYYYYYYEEENTEED